MKIETANLKKLELHELMGSLLAPLPVTLISTVGPDGTYNAAPFSFVAPVCSKPAIICVSIALREGQKKDTLKNIEYSQDFVVNSVDESTIKQAVQAGADYPYGVDEIKETRLTAVKSEKVKSPRIAEAKVSLECRFVQKLEFKEAEQGLRTVVFGEIVLIHIKDEVWVEGKIEPSRQRSVGRVGKNMYCRTGDTFEVKRA